MLGLMVATHVPVAEQTVLPEHVPQFPPHPFGPHVRPAQLGTQTHAPAVLQTRSPGQLPQDTRHEGSKPHVRPAQLGVHVGVVHVPAGVQTVVPAQVPQFPPHPFGPHVRPAQLGTQTHRPPMQR
jgi:hypothetical protein